MVRFFNIREPGPTDLTWDEKNSSDYLYRPVDLSKLRTSIKKGSISKKKRKRKEAEEASEKNE